MNVHMERTGNTMSKGTTSCLVKLVQQTYHRRTAALQIWRVGNWIIKDERYADHFDAVSDCWSVECPSLACEIYMQVLKSHSVSFLYRPWVESCMKPACPLPIPQLHAYLLELRAAPCITVTTCTLMPSYMMHALLKYTQTSLFFLSSTLWMNCTLSYIYTYTCFRIELSFFFPFHKLMTTPSVGPALKIFLPLRSFLLWMPPNYPVWYSLSLQ